MKGEKPDNIDKVRIVYEILNGTRDFIQMDDLLNRYRDKTGVRIPRLDILFALKVLSKLKVLETNQNMQPGYGGCKQYDAYRIFNPYRVEITRNTVKRFLDQANNLEGLVAS